MNGSVAVNCVCAAAEAAGLAVTYLSGGRARIQAPGHSAADRSVSVRPRPDGTDALVTLFAGDDKDDFLNFIGLRMSDLFDKPREYTQQPPPRRCPKPRDPAENAEQVRKHIAALVEHFGSIVAAGKALADILSAADPRCVACRTGEKLGGLLWWRSYCRDCATGWAPLTELDEAARWNAVKAAAVSISGYLVAERGRRRR